MLICWHLKEGFNADVIRGGGGLIENAEKPI